MWGKGGKKIPHILMSDFADFKKVEKGHSLFSENLYATANPTCEKGHESSARNCTESVSKGQAILFNLNSQFIIACTIS